MKIKLEEKVILDKEHQKIIAALDKDIQLYRIEVDQLKKTNFEMANIEKQHKHMNGELHKEISKLKQEIKDITNQNRIFKQHLQAKVLRSNKS